MEIVVPGNMDRVKKIKTFECETCGCVFKASLGEYSSVEAYVTQHDGIEAECKCPYCGNMVFAYR